MLRTKLFRALAVFVLVFGGLSAFLSMRMIQKRVVQEAQSRVRLDLTSAWAVYETKLEDLRTILKLLATKQVLTDACREGDWDDREQWDGVRSHLAKVCLDLDLDFLTVANPEGKVLARVSPPHTTGGPCLTSPVVAKALSGESAVGTVLLSPDELDQEAAGLREEAFLVLEDTPHARPSPRAEENRGLVLIGAVPIKRGGTLSGIVYGGILLNRNLSIIDHLKEVVYKQEDYEGVPLGTVTIFLSDSRVATTVTKANGNRALGTRVSKEVADRVLDNGLRWVGRAFVVRDWYLTAYDPIRDPRGNIIGMLYVGILEKPFQDLGRSTIMRYAALAAVGLIAALAFAFFLAAKLSAPLNRLSQASEQMGRGERPGPVPVDDTCRETTTLTRAFNDMAQTLAEREQQLRESNQKLEETNAALIEVNHNYMETLQFVTHEMKSPLNTMMNYTYMLSREKIGPLTEKQRKAVESLMAGVKRFAEMIRHYLNLARIENDELEPVKTDLSLVEDVVAPVIDALDADREKYQMKFENQIPSDIRLHYDKNMLFEVFENLMSNAVKYGREGGLVTLDCTPKGDLVECAVRNEGEGIEPDRLKDLFQKFSRVEKEKKGQKPKGTGLGLFITRKIIETHGGTIVADSKAGEWTEFRFTLPRSTESAG